MAATDSSALSSRRGQGRSPPYEAVGLMKAGMLRFGMLTKLGQDLPEWVVFAKVQAVLLHGWC